MAGSGRICLLARGHLLNALDDAAPELGIGDAREGAGERQSFRCGKKIRNISGRLRLAQPGESIGASRSAFEQKRHRDLKNIGNLLQAACPDAVGALLVFLNLLESQAEPLSELF